jgi:hypothetical protein
MKQSRVVLKYDHEFFIPFPSEVKTQSPPWLWVNLRDSGEYGKSHKGLYGLGDWLMKGTCFLAFSCITYFGGSQLPRWEEASSWAAETSSRWPCGWMTLEWILQPRAAFRWQQPLWHLDYRVIRDYGPEPPDWSLLDPYQKMCETISMCCFNLLCSGIFVAIGEYISNTRWFRARPDKHS